jgi:hypothetical protein
MPGWFGRFVAGAAGGLAGGVVFGVLMQLTGTLPMVASLVDRESVAVGWAIHMGIAVAVGFAYTLIFGLFSEGLPISAVLGAFYGIVWWVLGGLTLMPLRLGLGLFVFDTAAWQSLAGHIAYGLVLGMVYAVVAHRLARRRERGRAGSLRVPPPVVSPAAIQPPVSRPSPVAYPRSGVTPLSPQARALRQRGQRRS